MVADRPRFPAAVYRHGDEPDARFTFANERTFLAWIRTSLALIAGGVALELLGLDLQSELRLAASLVLTVVGIMTPALAWVNWVRSERALRLGGSLPASILAPAVCIAVTVSGALILAAVLL